MVKRPRRLRITAALRAIVAEAALRPEQLLAPFFVVPGSHETQPIAALPGVARLSVDRLLPQLERALALGVRSVMLFGVVPDSFKTSGGEAAAAHNSPVAQAIRAARAAFGNDLVVISDVCLCAYTDHGHCGLLRPTPRGVVIDNDLSLAGLAAMALAHAEAGADLVAPSDMMDGRVAAIRQALDAQGFTEVGILSYAVKYASAFYGPFREAAGSAPTPPYPPLLGGDNGGVPPLIGGDKGGVPTDRKTYQLDLRNAREALREAALDEAEGADLLMVKPALPYLDIIAAVRAQTTLPVVAYQVSGEYAMLKAAAAAGACKEPSAVAEALLSIRRAGADMIISYYALEALTQGWLE